MLQALGSERSFLTFPNGAQNALVHTSWTLTKAKYGHHSAPQNILLVGGDMDRFGKLAA